MSVRRAVLGLAAVAVLAAAGCGGSSGSGGGSNSGGSKSAVRLGPAFPGIGQLPGALHGGPPWPPAPKLGARLKAIGLPQLGQEGTVLHIHQHLDVYVNGRHVPVPALIGIDETAGFLTTLHTHDDTGIIHVESPTEASYSLGQFFAVWGLPLSDRCISTLCTGGGKQLKAWVNGVPVTANPTRIVLASHQEIVVAYGTAAQMPKSVPSSYDFPSGL